MALILRPDQVPAQVNSITQDTAHSSKSDKFVHLTQIETIKVLADFGLDLVHIKTGQARLQDRAAHQTSIVRFRSREALKINGLWLDIVLKMPHIYGAWLGYVGTYRQICTNGLVVGTKFATGRVAHTGDALSQLNAMIPFLISQHDQLVDSIRMMQSRDVSPGEVAELTKQVATLRLEGTKNVSQVQYSDLMRVRRPEDQGTDLFTVLNVLQENTMRHGFRYQTETPNPHSSELTQFAPITRNMSARPVTRNRAGDTETVRSVDLNASIWDAAMDILSQNKAA